MTPNDALEQSEAQVARLIVEDGAVAIARSVAGFQVSFIPRTAEGVWNLAATQILDKCKTLEDAVVRACENRECAYEAWEPAAENIVGNEPALSLAPSVEGHHLRYHGHPGSVLPPFPLQLSAAAGLLLGIGLLAVVAVLVRQENESTVR